MSRNNSRSSKEQSVEGQDKNDAPVENLQLYLASVNGDLDTARSALERGASVDYAYTGTSKDPKGMTRAKIELTNDTPLHCATESNNEELVRLLLKNAANPNTYRTRTVETYGRTKAVTENALIIAVRKAQNDPAAAGNIVKLLVEYNGDVRAISSSKHEKIRSETIKAYLRYDFYALNHINYCINTNISTVDVSSCGIADFQSFFPESTLNNLAPFVTTINLSNNKLVEIPASISRLKNLTNLNLSNNNLNDLPPSVAVLFDLKILNLTGNPLAEIPKFIQKQGTEAILGYYTDILEGVTEVCFETKLLFVGEENVGKTALLGNITKLKSSGSSQKLTKETKNISTHGIDTFTFTLKGIMESRKFHSSGSVPSVDKPTSRRKSNPVSMVRRRSSFVPRSALTSPAIRRSSDVLTQIPSPALSRRNTNACVSSSPIFSELELTKVSEIELESFLGTKIERIFTRFSHETDGIETKKIKKRFTTYKQTFCGIDAVNWILRETKISLRILAQHLCEIFILRGYIKPLSKYKRFNENSTYVLSDGEDVTVDYLFHSYDFAGQEIYYPTHQFFLSPKAIYVVVFDLRKDLADTRLEYWLQSIQGRAGDSGFVILVGTHADDDRFQENSEVVKALEAVQEKFCPRYPFVQSIFGISNRTGYGVDLVRERLVSAAQSLLQKMPPIPVKYRHLENMLLQEKEKRKTMPVLEWKEVLEIGKFLDMTDRVVTRAIEFLHNRGVICFFPALDCVNASSQLVTLDPQWLTKCMGNLIGSGTQQSFVKRGIIIREQLHHIWKHPMFPPPVHSYLLKILETIDVIFMIPNSAKEMILIPCLLPSDPPATLVEWMVDDAAEIVRIYHLKYFPSGFFSRIIIRVLQLRDPNLMSQLFYWQTGITIKFRNGVSLLVEQFLHKRNLIVRVRGIENNDMIPFCRDLFKDVLEMINLLTRYWFHLHTLRYIPCPQCISRERATKREQFTNEMITDDSQIHYFSVAECIDCAASNFPTLSCQICQNDDGKFRVNLSVLAPDLLLETIRTNEVDYNELQGQEEIGAGAFGIVFKAMLKEQAVACKKLTDIKSEAAFTEFISEVSIMADLFHPCLANMIGYCKKPPTIVMEYIPHGNLYDLLHSDAEISWPYRIRVALDVGRALSFLHSMTPAVIHRDLKSPNILVNSLSIEDEVVAKVADFGLSTKKWLDIQEEQDKRDVQNPVWLAPEILHGSSYDEMVDCYALGVIMWELLAREHPYAEFQYIFSHQLETAIEEGTRPSIPPYSEDEGVTLEVYEGYTTLLVQCWAPTASARPTAQGIVYDLETLLLLLSKQ